MSQKTDIFDEISYEPTRFNGYVAPPKVELGLSPDIKALFKSEIEGAVKQAVSEAIKSIVPKLEPKVIEKVVQTPERIIEKDVLDDKKLQKAIDEKVKKAVEETAKNMKVEEHVVIAPMNLPNMAGQGGKVLSTDGTNPKWITAATGGGGSSPESYTANNVTTTRTLDADDTSMDGLADVVGSLITDLKTAGILQ